MAQSQKSSCRSLLKIKCLSETLWVQCSYIFQWKAVFLEISWPDLSGCCNLSELTCTVKNDNRSHVWNEERKTAEGRRTVTRNSNNIFHVFIWFGVFLMVQFAFFFVYFHIGISKSQFVVAKQRSHVTYILDHGLFWKFFQLGKILGWIVHIYRTLLAVYLFKDVLKENIFQNNNKLQSGVYI